MILTVPVSKTDDKVKNGFINAFNAHGPYENHKLVVVCRPDDQDFARDVLLSITKGHNFQEIDFKVFDTDGIRGWPRGCNHYWAETVKYFQYDKKITEPWLWLEMDMVPLSVGWADVLEAEYIASGKPFMGNLGNTTTVTSKKEVITLCKHLVGAAIHPPNIDKYSTIWKHVQDLGIAWDVLCQWEFVPLAHNTKRMQHVFRTCNYTHTICSETGRNVIKGEMDENMKSVSFPEPYDKEIDMVNSVLVHGCTDNTLSDIVCKLKYSAS